MIPAKEIIKVIQMPEVAEAISKMSAPSRSQLYALVMENKGLSISELAQKSGVSPSAVSQILDVLKEARAVTIELDESDGAVKKRVYPSMRWYFESIAEAYGKQKDINERLPEFYKLVDTVFFSDTLITQIKNLLPKKIPENPIVVLGVFKMFVDRLDKDKEKIIKKFTKEEKTSMDTLVTQLDTFSDILFE